VSTAACLWCGAQGPVIDVASPEALSVPDALVLVDPADRVVYVPGDCASPVLACHSCRTGKGVRS
jgi:hypothetical protein